jgi:branched-chain amino acid aminotransferase
MTAPARRHRRRPAAGRLVTTMRSGLSTVEATGPIWIDGDLVAWQEAKTHVASFGLHNAGCVFEGIRVYGGRPFALREHCERLAASARALGFELPCGADDLRRVIQRTIDANGHHEAYVRPVAWRGSEVVGIDPTGTAVHLAVLVLPWPRRERDDPTLGVSLCASQWRRPGPRAAPTQAKASCHYVTGALALQEANAAGYDDALLLDDRGRVAEATGANVFAVRGGVITTPIADSALAGITRRIVLTLARDIGLDVVEARVTPAQVRDADEVFLTGTACEIQPVCAVLDRRLPAGHPVTDLLRAAYVELTRGGVR